MSQLVLKKRDYQFLDKFYNDLKDCFKINLDILAAESLNHDQLIRKIELLNSEKPSLEKLVIERILYKTIDWMDLLEILTALNKIVLDDEIIFQLWNDTIENSAKNVLQIIKNYN